MVLSVNISLVSFNEYVNHSLKCTATKILLYFSCVFLLMVFFIISYNSVNSLFSNQQGIYNNVLLQFSQFFSIFDLEKGLANLFYSVLENKYF